MRYKISDWLAEQIANSFEKRGVVVNFVETFEPNMIIKETEKAYYVNVVTETKDGICLTPLWIPKSECHEESEQEEIDDERNAGSLCMEYREFNAWENI